SGGFYFFTLPTDSTASLRQREHVGLRVIYLVVADMLTADADDLAHPSRTRLEGGEPEETTKERRDLPDLLGGQHEADDAEPAVGGRPVPEVLPVLRHKRRLPLQSQEMGDTLILDDGAWA